MLSKINQFYEKLIERELFERNQAYICVLKLYVSCKILLFIVLGV